jgi:fructosamine-3-kinase
MQIVPMREAIAILIARISRRMVEIVDLSPVSGPHALVATLADGGRFFVKAGAPEQRAQMRAEARGLDALRSAGAVRVPQLWLAGGEGPHYFLLLEYFELQSGNADAHAHLGRGLAAQHRHTSGTFGFERDNYIGATPQKNHQGSDWPAFFRDQRLLPQLQLAQGQPWVDDGMRLAEHVADFFPGYAPVPSLLHGDLWNGNAGFLADGTPVLFDPAVYYGDREADLAMSELFGGFAPSFYAAYREAWPLDPGHAQRKDLYNLYHLLNHHNLFGGNYGARAHDCIARLLAAVR